MNQDLAKILRLPGSLVLGPTNLGGAYPYGGTELGYTRENVLDFGLMSDETVAEEWGAVSESGDGTNRPKLGFLLEQFDTDLLPNVFSSTAVSGGNFRVGLATYPTGRRVAMAPLLKVPTDRTLKALLIHRPVLALTKSAAMRFSSEVEAYFPLVVWATPDDTGKDPVQLGELGILQL